MARASRGGITMQDISQMLIEGGYFRAKIRTMTDFDKVAGGLSWGILNSRFSIDVEFIENASIRDKIRISENICAALKQDMHCPHDLEPHQIQGLDTPKIAIVLEWLLKRVAAAREENAHLVREFTKLDFKRRFGSNLLPPVRKRPALAPTRVMISSQETYLNAVEHASTVLLEYGLKYQIKDSVLLLQHAEEMEGDAELQRDLTKMQEDEHKEQAMLDHLLGQMAAHKEKTRISTTGLSTIMSAVDSSKLSKMRGLYDQRKAELLAKLEEEERERNALDRQRDRLQELLTEIDESTEASVQHKLELKSMDNKKKRAVKEHSDRVAQLEQEINDIDEIEKMLRSDPARSEQYDALLALLEAHQKLEAKIEKEKVDGKQKLLEARQECVDLANTMEVLASDEGKELFESEKAKLERVLADLRAELSTSDQSAMNVLRKIDEFPTRAELKQYELRIDELNEEVAWKFEETRLMYNKYNIKAEISKCNANEETVMTSIGSLFDQCVGKKSSKKHVPERTQLLEQCSDVVTQLDSACGKQRSKLALDQSSLQELKAKYDGLVDTQKNFVELVEKFRLAMDENVSLQARCQPLEVDEEAAAD